VAVAILSEDHQAVQETPAVVVWVWDEEWVGVVVWAVAAGAHTVALVEEAPTHVAPVVEDPGPHTLDLDVDWQIIWCFVVEIMQF